MVSQQTITLQQCYDLALVNYPLAKQSELLDKKSHLEKEIVSNAKLPQLNFEAQATYQSEVIEVPIPNSNIEPLNKDQYRTTLSINQLIYNDGAINAALNAQSSKLKTQKKQVEVNLYQLKQQINQLYFSVLLSQETYFLLKAKEEQLHAKLKEVSAGIKYGILLPSSENILEAELLKLKQQFIDVESNRISLIHTLSSIIGQDLDTSVDFQNVLIDTQLTTELNRPELELFQLRKDEIESNEVLIGKQNAPKVSGFATGGYGNPGLNMLDNSFQPFYFVGLKLNWNVFDWNSSKKQRESLSITKDIIDTETETFTLTTHAQLNQQQNDIEKIKAFINSDVDIINLRKKILKSADSQLKNGVITSSAYITELTNLFEDENTLIKHKTQLQLAKANYNLLKGD